MAASRITRPRAGGVLPSSTTSTETWAPTSSGAPVIGGSASDCVAVTVSLVAGSTREKNSSSFSPWYRKDVSVPVPEKALPCPRGAWVKKPMFSGLGISRFHAEPSSG